MIDLGYDSGQDNQMELLVPHKHHQSRQHKFTKAKYKVTNWSEYTEALRRRGNITIWFTDDAIANWHPEKIPGKRGFSYIRG